MFFGRKFSLHNFRRFISVQSDANIDSHSKKNFIGMTKDEIFTTISDLGLGKYRANQIWDWIYRQGLFSH
jgi:hypothetical protein